MEAGNWSKHSLIMVELERIVVINGGRIELHRKDGMRLIIQLDKDVEGFQLANALNTTREDAKPYSRVDIPLEVPE